MVSARGKPRQYLAYTTRLGLSPPRRLSKNNAHRAKALSPANGLSFKGNTDAALNMGYNLVILLSYLKVSAKSSSTLLSGNALVAISS